MTDEMIGFLSLKLNEARRSFRAEAEVVYFVFFWMPLKLTEVFNQAIATAIFDMAVNMGMSRAVRFSQIALALKTS
jgi:lysozyme family protein